MVSEARSGGGLELTDETRQGVRFLPADLFAEDSGIASACYDLVMCNNLLYLLHPQSAVETIGMLRRYLRGAGALVLSGCHPVVRAQAATQFGFEPWPINLTAIRDGWNAEPRLPWTQPRVPDHDPHFVLKTCEVFRAHGPSPPQRVENLLGRRAVAVCGMPRAGTSLIAAMVRIYGARHGLFVTPRYWMSPVRLEEGTRLNAINDDPDSTAADIASVMQEAADYYRVPQEFGVVCKLPQMVWRPTLLRTFSTVVMTVRPLTGWLDSAFRYRDTVLHAAGPAAWMPGPVQEHIRAHFDGPFLREYGRCTREQVEQLDEVLDVDHHMFEYGEHESMRRALELLGLPAAQALTEQWQGSRWEVFEPAPPQMLGVLAPALPDRALVLPTAGART